ncbi:MAG: hypothetical protein C0606_09455 [Hyphomicrobiales bacterium]|nr:MAG: hypothetical protein C0606_09455 [Hyphomicrobiales bacterium]
MVAAVEPGAPVWGRAVAHISLRRGYLAEQEDAQRLLLSKLQPLDLVVFSSKGRASGNLLPGLFTHVAIHTGTDSQLAGLGLWRDPELRGHRDTVRAGSRFIEADYRGVHLSTPAGVFNTDRVVILRPRGISATRRREASRSFFDHIGTDFDFYFDAGENRTVYCAELVNHLMPELALPIRQVYGRKAILPDEMIAASLDGDTSLAVAGYLKGSPNGWRQASRADLARDLKASWSRTPPAVATNDAPTPVRPARQ